MHRIRLYKEAHILTTATCGAHELQFQGRAVLGPTSFKAIEHPLVTEPTAKEFEPKGTIHGWKRNEHSNARDELHPRELLPGKPLRALKSYRLLLVLLVVCQN